MGRSAHNSTLGFWNALAAFPPILVRISARRRVGGNNCCALSSQEIAIVADIPLDRVREISEQPIWDHITIGEAERFCKACNFDPTNPADLKRQREYARSCQTNPNRVPFLYLRRSPWWTTEFKPLVDLLSRFRTSDELPSLSHVRATSGFSGSSKKIHA